MAELADAPVLEAGAERHGGSSPPPRTTPLPLPANSKMRDDRAPALDPALVARVADAVARAKRVLFVTGAGISAESGLPTYRGIGGLYSSGLTPEGYAIEDALSGTMLEDRPEICWRHIAQIEAACRGARPSRAHRLVAEVEERCEHVVVLTQNVDGLHAAAGSKDVIEIHGNVHRLVCTGCGRRRTVADYAGLAIPPYCEHAGCSALVRPEVVLFGEMLPGAAIAKLEREVARGFDVAFSIGTTSVFPYIAYPVLATKRRGGLAVEINPGTTEVSDLVDVRLPSGAGAALGAIVEALPPSGLNA